MEYAGKSSIAVLADTGYSRARRPEDWNSFSPTQSFIRLKERSLGSSVGPPSQPQPATNAAGPANIPSRMKSRRLSPRVSVIAGESPPIPTGDHPPQRRRIHQEHQDDVQ